MSKKPTLKIAVPTELTKEQKAELKKCETIIGHGQAAFFAAAEAVLTIWDQKLFSPAFQYANDYFAAKWDWRPSDVTKYKNAGEILKLLKANDFDKLPENEGQSRALTEVRVKKVNKIGFDEKATDLKRVEVWKKAVESGEKITGALIRSIANPQPPKAENVPTDTATAQQEEVPVSPPLSAKKKTSSRKCSALITVEMDSTVLKDAAEYKGVPCEVVGENLYQVQIFGEDKSSLIMELASWPKVYAVKSMTIIFE